VADACSDTPSEAAGIGHKQAADGGIEQVFDSALCWPA